MPQETILILGGTREAAELAEKLTREKPDARIVTSLAGRTENPRALAGEVRAGGFGGAEGLGRFITENAVTQVIDATHPFAAQISENARAACAITGIPLESLRRKPWAQEPGDNWIEFASLEQAASAIPSGARVLLALGSQHLFPFQARADVHFLIRMVDAPKEPLKFADHILLLEKPGNTADEAALLAGHNISHVLCRNSGGESGYGKIAAARQLGLPVIMIARPG